MQYLDDEIPQSLDCCKPIEYPVEVALGSADFIAEDVAGSDSFIRAYYRLLNTGFRPGFAAGTDYPCGVSTLGSLLTYVQVAGGQMTYRNWIDGIANGRTVISRNGHNEFLALTVNNSATPGDEINLAAGGGSVPVNIVWTANQNLSGTIELVKNGVLVASVPKTAAPGAPASFSTTVNFTKSGWLAARRMDANGHQVHTAAVFVTVDNQPVRASAADAEFYVQWMDNLLGEDLAPAGNGMRFSRPSLAQAQERYQAARAIFAQIAVEAGGSETPPTVVSVSPNSGATGVSTGSSGYRDLQRADGWDQHQCEYLRPEVPFRCHRGLHGCLQQRHVHGYSEPDCSTGQLHDLHGHGDRQQRAVSRDSSGTPLTADYSWSFTTAAAGSPGSYSLWNDTVTPAILSDSDTAAVELGVKFQSSLSGFITALRFYKAPANTGTHVGNLWTAAGALMASVTFTNETASGWQQMNFAAPVPITANTTYVASYHTNVGRYSADSGYFSSSGFSNPPLQALSNSQGAGNGVYRYGTGSAFPNQTWNSTNYWVDVVFKETLEPDTTPPTVSSVSPPAGATSVATGTAVSATFSEAMAPASINSSTFELRIAGGSLVAGAVSYNATTRTATLTPSAALSASTGYTALVKSGSAGVKDAAGNPLSTDYTWSFTTAAVADTTPPTVTAAIPSNNATGVAINTQVSAVFSEPLNPATVTATTFELRNSAGILVSAAVAYNASNQTAVLTPGSPLAYATSYTATGQGRRRRSRGCGRQPHGRRFRLDLHHGRSAGRHNPADGRFILDLPLQFFDRSQRRLEHPRTFQREHEPGHHHLRDGCAARGRGGDRPCHRDVRPGHLHGHYRPGLAAGPRDGLHRDHRRGDRPRRQRDRVQLHIELHDERVFALRQRPRRTDTDSNLRFQPLQPVSDGNPQCRGP